MFASYIGDRNYNYGSKRNKLSLYHHHQTFDEFMTAEYITVMDEQSLVAFINSIVRENFFLRVIFILI